MQYSKNGIALLQMAMILLASLIPCQCHARQRSDHPSPIGANSSISVPFPHVESQMAAIGTTCDHPNGDFPCLPCRCRSSLENSFPPENSLDLRFNTHAHSSSPFLRIDGLCRNRISKRPLQNSVLDNASPSLIADFHLRI